MGFLHWLRALHMRKRHVEQLTAEVDAALLTVQRLEIAFRLLKERQDALEGRHDSLSAQFRGRMGGRPPVPRNGSDALQAPMLLGGPLFQRQE